jgi:teichuronic acid biosynthesis glycosyltransferase TuaG
MEHNNKIKISVITTTFNSIKFLPYCIESIQKQTYTNYEHIIINDGSSDGSKEYLDSISDEKIRVIHLPRSGRGKSLNKGLYESRGQYIAILDADDISISTRLEVQKNILDSKPEYDLISSLFEIYKGTDADKEKITNLIDSTLLNLKKLISSDFIYTNPICHSSVMMRKDIFKKVDNYDDRRTELFDFELWIRMLITNKVKMYLITEALVFRNLHNQQYFESKKRLRYLYQTYLLRRQVLGYMKYSYFYHIVIIFILFYGLLPRYIRKHFMN